MNKLKKVWPWLAGLVVIAGLYHELVGDYLIWDIPAVIDYSKQSVSIMQLLTVNILLPFFFNLCVSLYLLRRKQMLSVKKASVIIASELFVVSFFAWLLTTIFGYTTFQPWQGLLLCWTVAVTGLMAISLMTFKLLVNRLDDKAVLVLSPFNVIFLVAVSFFLRQ